MSQARPRQDRVRHRVTTAHIVNYAFAIIYAIVIIIPFYYVVVSSFKTNAGIYGDPLGLPTPFDSENYPEAQQKANLLHAIGVSFLIVVATETALLVMGFPLAYAIARIPVRLAKFAEILLGVGFLIPTFSVLIPIFLLAARTGLLFNPLAVILFYLAARMPLTAVVLASHLREIPLELEESAEIDGANPLQIIVRIILPLSKPGIATVLILNFLYIWNEYLFALVLLNDETRTVQLAMPFLKGERLVDFGLLAAGVVISIIPVFAIFVFFQEQIVKGMLGGAVKG